MSGKSKSVDRFFLIVVALLLALGLLLFISAALGLYARNSAVVISVIKSQLFGVFIGLILMIAAIATPLKTLKKLAAPLFGLSLLATLLVHVPGIGFSSGGATRWLNLGGFTIQPAEVLKLTTILFLASWLAKHRRLLNRWQYSLGAFVAVMSAVGITLMSQPDAGTTLVIALAAFAVFMVSNVPWKHIGLLMLSAPILLFGAAAARPYIRERLFTFLSPSSDPLGDSYQIQQSLIAVGSGQLFGRGFGQSVQKFNFLPEPVGDSIFAVTAEEWGFIGASLLIIIFLVFIWRGVFIAIRSRDEFSRLLVIGLITLIAGQSFINIAAMLGLFPLTGMPLIFVSHGGTAMMLALAEIGIILNVSQKAKLK